MKKIAWVALYAMLIGIPSFAAVEVRTIISDVLVGADDQATGEIWMVVEGDDFASASKQSPAYIRLSLDHDATLADTRVSPVRSRWINRTIFLALQLDNAQANQNLNAPLDSVSIVRWIEGENQIWLKITSSSSNWVTTDGVSGPPTTDQPVSFRLGQTARRSLETNLAAFFHHLANLPANVNHFGRPVSTVITVDLTDSDLLAVPAPPFLSILSAVPTAFDEDTQGVGTASSADDIVLGSTLPVTFNGDFWIARGIQEMEKRSLPALTSVEKEGQSWVYFLNPLSKDQTVELLLFDENGAALPSRFLDLAASSFRRLNADDLFANGAARSFRLDGPDASSVVVGYQEPGSSASTLSLEEGRKTMNR